MTFTPVDKLLLTWAKKQKTDRQKLNESKKSEHVTGERRRKVRVYLKGKKDAHEARITQHPTQSVFISSVIREGAVCELILPWLGF